ncbi:TBC1 domain family member 2B [Babesia sp. Xinjiang]|uniref:TBC1 domain family member 2B n=1 Tax=Babesia sp. Xinjiang TaxID=462227 RepID=UPI000A226F18|nr:TBC1 domain family member 2B [Babesia sp. Xinjiang]XP_028871451.1 TBC1 domain family member 2B [Babesia sp. Xinjiang]ORM40853.1 TBC1 domain family member 2B [Babesia sp. Xinjiang]ORM40995.1 TBC1 domain family member 2B [Babesia sp. Xinjiang]
MAEPTELGLSGNAPENKKCAQPRPKATPPPQEEESPSLLSMFNIFGFGAKSVMGHTATYGMMPSMPQCECVRIALKPPKASDQSTNPTVQKNIPKYIRPERCARFNYWWLKCCQSAVLRKAGVYWNVVELLDEKVIVDGVKMPVADLVLGQKTTTAILLDIRRTYPSLKFYTRYGRLMLRRILLAYAFFDPEVGYVQGLNFIVANLLWHCTEEQAFWAFISIMYMYDCRCMFLQGLPGVFRRCDVIEKCMEDHVPKLTEHLRNVGVHIPMIASDWLMTLCANSIPIKPLARLWDSFFAEGWIVIFRFILFRLKQFEPYLLTMHDVADIMKVIKYGHANQAESWSFIELIPGFGQTVENKGIKLVQGAYYSNCENLTNDPNKNSNDHDWMEIVMGSLKFNLSSDFVDKLELQSTEDLYYECANAHNLFPNDETDCKSEGLVSETSSENDVRTTLLEKDHQSSEEQEHLPQNITKDTPAYDLLRKHGCGVIADKLEEFADTFRKQLSDIGLANPYVLHLKALRDE